MVGWSSPYYLISGIEHVASLLTPDREYLVTADIHELNADVWDLPHPLSQALDGYNQPDLYDADDTWQATIDGQYSVWMLAERFRLKLKTAKQAQGVKEALLGAGVDLPRTWSGALKALADAAPESMNHDLAEQFNRLS